VCRGHLDGQLLTFSVLFLVFLAFEIDKHILRDLILVLDEENGMKLFICPEEILVQLQQSQGIDALQELEDLIL
jgi:hypothetical protein